jgi:hypothetical protein
MTTANFLSGLAQAILSVIVGWDLYVRTDSAFALGLVGLVQIVPNVLLAIPAGQFVDRHNRQRIMTISTLVTAVAAIALAALSAGDGPLVLIYACLFVLGLTRVFRSPSQGALLAAVVPGTVYGNAAAWSSNTGQLASVIGPAIGGIAVAISDNVAFVFVAAGLMLVTATILYSRMHPRPIAQSEEPVTKESLLAGIHFIRNTKVMLAAITLDMVAVLLGGATALLPIFAKDVLHVGATGLGLMRAAPSVGAIVMSFAIAHRGAFKRSGPTLLGTVAAFGLATLLFGVSRNIELSLVALVLLGAFDAVSMVIRDTLELTYTPDDMRGRVGSIHFLFIGMSNEFGEFESGVAAALLGATTAVVLGGIGTLLVVPAIAIAWPQMMKLREIKPLSAEELAIASGRTPPDSVATSSAAAKPAD